MCLLKWFDEKGRHFPWRNKSATNYEKIISEVLLQRTKAETVAKFFPGFLKKYPSWKKLASATIVELEETLTPIGLQKQRSRRLFPLAREMGKRKGRLPVRREEIEAIPMFGQYITNAIMLLVYGLPAPLLDVNMSRLLERFFGPRQMSDIRYDPYLQDLAYKVVDHDEARKINWAVLDFAALVCKARQPNCSGCPLAAKCKFFKSKKKKS
jgi:A/G-specific adenine glycosylase